MAKLSYLRGTTYEWTFNYTPVAGAADGATCLFTLKTEVDDDSTDSAAIVKKNITMSDNSCTISIDPGDVADTYDASKNYVFDIRVIDGDGNIYPALSGKFELDVTATNRITV